MRKIGRHKIIWDNEKIKNLWDYYSGNSFYDNQYFSGKFGVYIIQKLKRIIDFRGKDILDYGCGSGFLFDRISKYVGDGKIWGADFSENSVKNYRASYQNKKNYGGCFLIEDARLDIPENSFDMIICIEVVEHLDDTNLGQLAKEAHRLLRPGGKLVVTTPNREDLLANETICPECGCVFHRWQHLRTWDKKSIQAFFLKKGFKSFHTEETVFESPVGRIYHFLRSFLKEKTLPHLLFIGTK